MQMADVDTDAYADVDAGMWECGNAGMRECGNADVDVDVDDGNKMHWTYSPLVRNNIT